MSSNHAPSTSAPALQARGITKTFPGGVVANRAVDFDLRRGEVHCLLGENGAGKSTLVNIVYGLYQPDEGAILVDGNPVHFRTSADAIAAGIGMVHQHFQQIPVFTVAENIVLGNEPRRGVRIDLARASKRIGEIGQRYGLAVDPDALIADLSVGEQQRVELVKALYRDAEILILDEPTAVLTPGEVDEFFGVVRSLVDQGTSIVFITNKLREVLDVADRITVLRDGRTVGSADPATASEQDLANLMVGRDVLLRIAKTDATPGPERLMVRDLVVHDDRGLVAVDGVSFAVRAGEVFGIAGVDGNGQRELVEALAGMRAAVAGSVHIGDVDVTQADARSVSELGVGHVPEDRSRHGVIAQFTLADNLVLNSYFRAPFARRRVRNDRAVRAHARELVERFDIRARSLDSAVSDLSGGNQQKVIIARELSGNQTVLLVAQPTRGLDVGSIEFIHHRIIELRDQGAAVLLVSAELDEILGLADRIGVLYRGRLVEVVERAATSREEIGLFMATGESARAS